MQVIVEICVCVWVSVSVGAGTYVSACAVTSTRTSFAKSRSPAGQPGKPRRGSRFAFYEKLICFLCFAIIFYFFVVPLVGGKHRTLSLNHLHLGTVLPANQSVWLIFRRIVTPSLSLSLAEATQNIKIFAIYECNQSTYTRTHTWVVNGNDYNQCITK